MFVVRDGKISWSYSIPTTDAQNLVLEFSDTKMVSNGNVISARKTGAGLVTSDKKHIWNYDAPRCFEVHVAQP